MPLITEIIQETDVSQENCGKLIKTIERDNDGYKCVHTSTHWPDGGESTHNLIFAKTSWMDPE